MMIKYIPNLLCIFRILLAPLFLLTFSNNLKVLSIFILSLGSISDFLDGYLARKFKVESKFGELLDPLADKIFSNSVLLGIYAYNNHQFIIFMIAISLIVRDVFLLIGSCFVIHKKLEINIGPIYISKICTALILILCFLSIVLDNSSDILEILGLICFALIIMTFMTYIRRFYRSWNKPPVFWKI